MNLHLLKQTLQPKNTHDNLQKEWYKILSFKLKTNYENKFLSHSFLVTIACVSRIAR